MCRWLAYSGSPILLEELLYKPKHSLIDQSLHARLGVETTNGDGFGVGWYSTNNNAPAVFRSVEPAWNDRNLREVATHIASPLEAAVFSQNWLYACRSSAWPTTALASVTVFRSSHTENGSVAVLNSE